MKLIVLILVSITVFMANCRERPDSREISDNDNNLSDDQHFFDDGDLSDGRDLFDDDELPYGGDLTDGANNETSTTEPDSFYRDPMDLLSSRVDRQLKEEGKVQNERKLQGGSKCKSDIVCSLLGGSCVANSTYCSGREVPSVCSGAKCKCCITVNLEVKVHDLETELRAMVVNLTSANSNLNTKLDSIMSTNSNLTIANTNMDLKMDSIMATNSNLTIANSNIDIKMDSIMSTNSNLTIANSNMDLKMDSMMATNSNLTIANSNMDLKIDSLMSTNSNLTIANSNLDLKMDSIVSTSSNLTISNANQDSKLDSIREHQGCPEGLFLFTPSNQCFRLLNDTRRSWDNAKSACRALGLELAHPYDPIPLRAYLMTKHGLTAATWLDAKGDGSNIRWQRNGQAVISQSNPLWWPGNSVVRTGYCLALMTHISWWKSHPTTVYHSHWTCGTTWWALCEFVRE